MPSMDGGDQCSPDYAPHMWLDGHFIHNTEQIVQVGEWWYRGGRLDNETIVAERWQGDRDFRWRQRRRQMVPAGEMPEQLLRAMSSVSRGDQEALQAAFEMVFGHHLARGVQKG